MVYLITSFYVLVMLICVLAVIYSIVKINDRGFTNFYFTLIPGLIGASVIFPLLVSSLIGKPESIEVGAWTKGDASTCVVSSLSKFSKVNMIDNKNEYGIAWVDSLGATKVMLGNDAKYVRVDFSSKSSFPKGGDFDSKIVQSKIKDFLAPYKLSLSQCKQD